MVGIDFTWINLNGKLTQSLEIFTCDLLDCIAQKNQQDNFVIITHPVMESLLRERFPMFQVYGMGGCGLKLLHSITRKEAVKFIKKHGIYDFLLQHYGIEHVWIPALVPSTFCNIKTDYIGTCHDLMTVNKIDSTQNYKTMFECAQKIVTISNYVKGQIIDEYHIQAEKIIVIPNSIYISNDIIEMEEIPVLKNKEFLLDCNAYASRKNTLVMIKAFERIADYIAEDLVLCGGYMDDNYFNECTQYIKDHRLENRIHVFLSIDEKQKNWLFQNCRAFITPSENEGFGRTPIEAALFLKPVISSRATSLEEATCGMVHYIENPRDDKELADAILNVLRNPDSPERLKQIKETFKQKYSADKIVHEYIDLFHSLGWIDNDCI